jgi:hypothetical protein
MVCFASSRNQQHRNYKQLNKSPTSKISKIVKYQSKSTNTEEKSGIRSPSNFKILGYAFVPTYKKAVKGKYQLFVEEKRWKILKTKLKEITRKTSPLSFDERVQKIKEVQRGWINDFQICEHV